METHRDKTILVVDDSTEDIDILVNILSRYYKVKVTLNGKQALDYLGNKHLPDLILLDILMPGLSGFEVCRKLKESRKNKDIPVIFISALTNTSDIIEGFELGGVDYVTKPFHPEEVYARVNTHMKIKEYQLQLENKNIQLKKHYNALKDLEKQRDNLTNMIIHDMRSPLQVIGGYIDLINKNKALTDEELHYINIMKTCCSGLTEMVSSLLDVSRLESNKLPLQIESFCLKSLIQEIVERFMELDNSPEIKVDLIQARDKLEADKDLVERIIINLLSNACKFTPKDGTITISMKQSGCKYRVSVTDTGKGILEEELTKIFEKFEQAKLREKKHKYSSGLGLTFCKLATEAHGGTIDVTSTLGKGSTFTVELPILSLPNNAQSQNYAI